MELTRYHFWGLRVASSQPWPALETFRVPGAGWRADVRITVGRPTACPASRVDIRPRQANLQIGGVGRFIVRSGRSIMVRPDVAASLDALELFLFGSAWGALCYQRGLLPLHASVVQTPDGALAFCGPSGAGKSSLAAWLARGRAWPLLSDDLCRCDPLSDPAPRVWPGLPRFKLWRAALEALGQTADGLPQDLLAEDKFHLLAPAAPTAGQTPLRAIFLLEWGPLNLQRLTGALALRRFVAASVYRAGQLEAMGRLADYWRDCASLLRRVPVFTLARPQGWDSMDAVVALVDQAREA